MFPYKNIINLTFLYGFQIFKTMSANGFNDPSFLFKYSDGGSRFRKHIPDGKPSSLKLISFCRIPPSGSPHQSLIITLILVNPPLINSYVNLLILGRVKLFSSGSSMIILQPVKTSHSQPRQPTDHISLDNSIGKKMMPLRWLDTSHQLKGSGG